MAKNIDSLIEWGYNANSINPTSLISPGESSLTSLLPRDITIYSNNNKYHPFSIDGIDKRTLNFQEQRLKNLLNSKEKASKAEVEDIQLRLDMVELKIENNKIHSRFEILDL